MKTVNTTRNLLLSLLLAVGSAASPAFAQVRFHVRVAPPAPLAEPMPPMAPGYVWAPGYWAWHGDRHVWVHGRSIMQRNGYRWQPDVWEQRNDNYYRHPGRWERERRGRGPGAHHQG